MSLFDRYVLNQLRQSEFKADQAQTEATRSQAEIDVLRLYVERISMITEALWIILKEKHGYKDEELMQRITEIDLRDGRRDGQGTSAETPTCPQCKRMHVAKHRPLCLYCGATVLVEPFSR